MDHVETTSLVFTHKNEVDGLVKLPLFVTGVIAHGHGDVHYMHYSLDIFPPNLIKTINSIAKLLRDVEELQKIFFSTIVCRMRVYEFILQGPKG